MADDGMALGRRPAEILLVEDNPVDARLVRQALADSGRGTILHHVTTGEDAVALLTNGGRRPHLVLLDLNLPRMDGRDVLVAIRGDVRLQDLPVVVLTSSSLEQDVRLSYRSHANGYVAKPPDVAAFLTRIREVEAFWTITATLPVAE